MMYMPDAYKSHFVLTKKNKRQLTIMFNFNAKNTPREQISYGPNQILKNQAHEIIKTNI